MKPFLLFILFVSGLWIHGDASAQTCAPIVGVIAEAIRCQRDLCKDLSVMNEKRVSKEGIYYVSCIQNYTFTSSRSDEPFVAEIDELSRTLIRDPKVLSPCDCLDKLAADFPDCKVKTCKSADPPKPAAPEPAAPPAEVPAAPAGTPSPEVENVPVGENAKVEPKAEGGCSLR